MHGGVALTQVLQPLISELMGQEPCWLLYNDSIACSSILSYPSGSWRTRHLRLRSKALQEMISDELLGIHHVPGKYMTADLLTKPLSPPRILELWTYAGLDSSTVDMQGKARTKANVEVAPIINVVMVSLLAVPVQAQGKEEPWTYRDIGIKLMLCVLVLFGVLALLVSCKRRTLRARHGMGANIVLVQTLTANTCLADHSLCTCKPVPGRSPRLQTRAWQILPQPLHLQTRAWQILP